MKRNYVTITLYQQLSTKNDDSASQSDRRQVSRLLLRSIHSTHTELTRTSRPTTCSLVTRVSRSALRLYLVLSAVFTCIGALGTPSLRGPLARKYLPGFAYS